MTHVWMWVAAGVVGGLLGRAWRGRGEATTASDVVGGLLGAFACGWAAHRAGLLGPSALAGHLGLGLAGALLVLAVLRAAERASVDARGSGAAGPHLRDLEDGLRRLGDLERRLWQGVLARTPSARDPNAAFDAQSTLGERVADRVARFGGSWTFIGLFAVIILGWMAVNEEQARPFDPYPFILLNLVLSCLAALQAPVIMMSQNRQGAKDRLDARADYEVNVRAELEVMALHAKVDQLRERDWSRVIDILERQARVIEALERRLGEAAE
ncbi:hypothetical protein TBR22_A12370 [Luteitalea sp. TBR-22]|uniref:DUF1003 domain-containing protein n=1 Tax=Luteitalea sp. TBR-22 TaxID=2802971 RepID=UPI001AF74286|nr:DUF1003 domain-containing protein [Luteitalea sp. TBR-22]BCS32032.1 hypothetical protein TBR22_A12370 [Luteitalea sp. TBR-22]